MTTLLVGFDSAWTAHDSGALVGLLHTGDGGVHELCPPRVVDYRMAETVIPKWKAELFPTSTLILLDQLTIVPNPTGQRRVENIVGSVVSLRRGGMQPANTSKKEMFGEDAPIWEFPIRFGGPTHPLEPVGSSLVIETYPVLTMIALGWMLPDMRATGRLPKYNPERRGTFAIEDWRYVCRRTSHEFRERCINGIALW